MAIETSCDETAAAVVEDGTTLLSNVVISQIDIHREFGGVVPEIAARSHIEVILPVIEKALQEAFPGKKDKWAEVDAVAVTQGPGLIGSLLIGTLTARTLALFKGKPLYGVNHVLGHIYANWLIRPLPKFPVLALIVSGGHSQLVLMNNHFDYQLLGQTRDDAVGEAYDKAAKVIGLPYPGGPSIEKLAAQGDPKAYKLPDAKLDNPYDFSFSGLKTALLRTAQKAIGEDHTFPSHQIAARLTGEQRADLAASFQAAAVATMVGKTVLACRQFQPATVVIAGGVAANQALRAELKRALPVSINYAPMNLCTDNAAMVASLAYFQAQIRPPDDPLKLQADPSLSI